jgi:hypothetical protein
MYENLFWVRIEWEGRIEFEILPESEPFYDYYNVNDCARLLQRTPPSCIGDRIRDWLAINHSLETVRKVGAVGSRVRRLIRWLLPSIRIV